MGSGRPQPRSARARRSSRLPTVCYLDASALAKLVFEEPESAETRFFIRGAQGVSSELMMTELPRALRHKAATERDVDLAVSLRKSEVVLGKMGLYPVERIALWCAEKIFEPHLRSLDPIHVMTALQHRPIDAFVTHDMRQAVAARDAGLSTVPPGMKS